jgi:hypothetical protein
MRSTKTNSSYLRVNFTNLLKKVLVLTFAVAVLIWFGARYFADGNQASAQQRSKGPLIVRGYISTMIGRIQDSPTAANITGREIYLPGITTFLTDATSGDTSETVVTDLSGRFTLKAKKAGRYRVCWKTESYVNGCSKDVVSVAGPVFVSSVKIDPDRSDPKMKAVIFGQVKMQDGSRARKLEPLLNVNAFAKVSLANKSGAKLQEVFVNNFGEYVIAKAPVKSEIFLHAQIEGGKREQRLLPAANIGNALFDPINLTINNTPPRVQPVVAFDSGGNRVKVARPGDVVFLKAVGSDKDGDSIKFKWRPADGSGSVSAADAPDTEWKLPNRPGLYSIKLLAWDKKGGYATSDLSLETGDGSIRFSGKVDGTDVPAIKDAEVEINGKTTVTDANGLFSIAVRDDKRFVLNIRKMGYGLVSRVYDDAVTGGQWTMTKASVTRVSPTTPIKVTEERNRKNCPGPEANRLNWSPYAKKLRPQWQDGKGNVISPKSTKLESSIKRLLPVTKSPTNDNSRCGPGARVDIPANALVSEQTGLNTSGPVDISIATIDLRSPEQMPGDYSVRTTTGDTKVMESYGAVSVDIFSGGERLNLKPGSTATITLPVDPAQIAAGGVKPPTIPVLFYDEKRGIWVEEGFARLVGNNYVAKVKHFSTINTDLIKTNQSCVKILSPTLPVNYDLEYTIPSPSGGGAAPIVRRVAIANGPPSEHVIYNLPSGVNIVLVPIRQSDNTPIGTFVVNTGGPQAPTTPNLPVGPPYNACSTTVTLQDQVVPEPIEEYLQGLYAFEATNIGELDPANPADAATITALNQATINYYDQIDPRNKRETLDEFKDVNGFNSGADVRASFANSGDLGFGRDMHCKSQASPSGDGLLDVACYVTNYGSILTSDQDDADQAHAALLGDRVATVAMEFSAVESPSGNPEFDDPERVVKFYVYNADGSALLNSADLDSGVNLRPRPIPQLCMVCHNGLYPSGNTTGIPTFANRDDVKMGARFLPFDNHYYTFPAANPKAAQQQAMKDLNDLVKLTHTQDPTSISATPVIPEMIDGMYTPPPPLPEQDENFVVAGWNSQPIQQGMYRDVIARTCRTCHVANIFGDSAGAFPLTFDQRTQYTDVLGKAESRVCTQHVMPHAVVPHRLFWQSIGPSMLAQFQVFGDTFDTAANGWNGTLCGSFTPGGGTPVPFYTSNIQPIWDGVGTGTTACTACHSGGSPSAGLDLSSGNSYGEIFNVPSGQAAGMDLIEPGNPAQSYLLHKLDNTHIGVGGSGSRMPLGGAAINAASRTELQNWVTSGAPGP